MHIIRTILIICAIGLCFFVLGGGSLSNDSVMVNLMIDVDSPPDPSQEMMNDFSSSLVSMMNVIDPKGLNVTLFVSGDAALFNRLPITSQGTMVNHELALFGSKTNEQLGSMSYSAQESLLTNAKKALEKCYICGDKQMIVKGFKPQSFDQNEDTYKLLVEKGIEYDAGFKAGLQYLPGHENDTWPYLMENYDLYAVPVSTYFHKGELVYLSDRALKEKGLSGEESYNIMVAKFDQCAKDGSPMIVVFSNEVSGEASYYLDAFKKFVEYATSKDATFVTTLQLVNKVKPLGTSGPGIRESETNTGCVDCDRSKYNDSGITSLMLNATVVPGGNCTNCDKNQTDQINITK
jgi:hypothetical protein